MKHLAPTSSLRLVVFSALSAALLPGACSSDSEPPSSLSSDATDGGVGGSASDASTGGSGGTAGSNTGGASAGSGATSGAGGNDAGSGGTDAGSGGGSTDAGPNDGSTTDSSQGGSAGGPQDAGADVDPAVYCQDLDDPHELISDRRFRRGFVSLDANGQPSTSMPTGFCQSAPIWHKAQWGSLGDLSTSSPQTLSDGSVQWSNQYGLLTVGKLGTPRQDLSFGVWAYTEYGGVYRSSSDSRVWVHLLAEQRISPPGVPHPGCPPISSLTSLNFRVTAQLIKDVPHYGPGYDKSQHAAQFLIYFTVQNLKQGSPGFGDYLWLGMTLYDDRQDIPQKYVNGDQGTGKLIYNIGATPFTSTGLKPGGPAQVFAKDLLPDVRDALNEAWKRGFLQDSHDPADYRIGGMNIGWEVPGLNDVEMRVSDLSLRYTDNGSTPPSGNSTFEFNQDGNTEGWTAVNLVDKFQGPVGGKWILTVPSDDPQVVSPVLNIDASKHPTLHVVFANDHNPASTSTMQVFWDRTDDTGFRESWSIKLPVKNDGGWQTLDIDMTANPAWSGTISRIRVDPVLSGDGHSIGFDRIAL